MNKEHTVKIPGRGGSLIDAKVGDTVAYFCIINKVIRVGKIQGVKNKFVIDGPKYTPKAKQCLWLSRPVKVVKPSSNKVMNNE